MSDFEIIKEKLESFTKKYYTNELIKGVILFFAIGLLYFILTLVIEHFLWLNSQRRTILFWMFIVVEVALLTKFILFPIGKLFKLSKGIDDKKASEIIGNHFPQVHDKLLNLLQLKENQSSSSLLLASIEQKSGQLKPIPFTLAINFRQNLKYLKYVAIPIVVFLLISIVSGMSWFSESYDRVLNYEIAYEPPAPFQFFIVNDKLQSLENEDYKLKVRTTGEIIPETATISYNDEVYFLKNVAPGEFQYTFSQPKKSVDFKLSSNEVSSREYSLEVLPIPVVLDFEMNLNYPKHTNKKNEQLRSSGNAVIPEGTQVSWKVHTRNTKEVNFVVEDSLINLKNQNADFYYETRLFKNLEYDISTSNEDVKGYDNLAFTIKVIKDQYPELNITVEKDTVDNRTMYFFGRVSDDYGLSKLRLVYYDSNTEKEKNTINLPLNRGVFDEFVYAFPGELVLENGVDYEFYFEIFDNDALHDYKKTRSQIFNYRKLTIAEEEEKRLQEQNEAISGLNKSLDKFDKQQKELQQLNKLQKEKKRLDYNDKKKLEDYLKKQKDQEKMMKNFAKKLKDNLESIEEKKEEPFKDALKEMMERNEEKLRKNEKLLEEIEKLSERIQKEELSEKLDELGKENKNIKKNLEQLLELTKRFYVIEKHEKLGDQLKELSEKQDQLAEEKQEENTKEKQDKLNQEFEKFQEEMEKLRKENENLKKPMSLHQDKQDEEDIKEEQKTASENLKEGDKEKAKKNQKSAAQKMRKMQEQMQQEMNMGGEAQQQEDAEMLRQILDNLVDFSLEQEVLMDDFKGMNVNNPGYSSKLRKQSVLRENFKHVDDSLYALALRTPKISDEITSKLTDVEFNMDKALERLAENQVIVGTANQQYTITAANELAYMLSRALDQMQNSMPSSGKGKGGKGKGFQLPDIIKKQDALNDKMKKGMEKGQKKGNKPGDSEGGEQKGKDGKDGKGKNKGGKGKEGDAGNNGQKGNKNSGGKEEGKGIGDREFDKQSEQMKGELFEIYKQQQELRNALKERISEEGIKDGSGSNLLRKMEEVEQQLLDKGFDNNILNKMLDLKHELLKMEDATIEQGEEERRESTTNKKEFDTKNGNPLLKAKQYFNTTELLNRQVLPLQQNYKKKVQEYFRIEND